LAKEALELHDSQFTAPTLIPTEGIWKWMSVRRPLLSELLAAQNKAKCDDWIIDSLLSLLHNPIGLTETQYQPYIKTNTLIKPYPILM